MNTVVPDSTCLIALERIGKLDILPDLFSRVAVPPAVDLEFGVRPEWLTVESLVSATVSDLLKITLGEGESEAIALALQLNCRLISDDKQARSTAEQLGIKVMGTLAVLIEAKRKKLIDEMKPVLDDLNAQGFRMSKQLYDEALLIADEN